jgi:hypothetical protein
MKIKMTITTTLLGLDAFFIRVIRGIQQASKRWNFLRWSIIMFSLLAGSCDSGHTLSKEKAKAIISKEIGYPKRETVRLGQSKEADVVEAKLKADGCIDTSNREWVIQGITARFKATPQGKPFLSFIEYTYYRDGTKATGIEIVVFERHLNEIVEVLSDSKQGVAEVKYTTIVKPYGPYYDFVRSMCPAPDTIQTERATLKKYDEGWRVR